MDKILTPAAVVLGCCLFTAAQTAPKKAPLTPTRSPQAATVQGCLNQSLDGNFLLTDHTGSKYHLLSDRVKLKKFVHNEIRVDGSAMLAEMSNEAPGAMEAPDAMALPQPGSVPGPIVDITVSSVRKISMFCQASDTNEVQAPYEEPAQTPYREPPPPPYRSPNDRGPNPQER